ncbi:hypothetical protein SAMN05216554_4299 [Herbiconiux ginsengi]|uniref:Uncharacterized protein n=1 Tax=Herbiconiux ginsengi TaxID=381665 RepID=A0A1H3TL90_9MICO|nr:hypothetical protein SAMN05216554_4299 [Herbiconiux ginsengi]
MGAGLVNAEAFLAALKAPAPAPAPVPEPAAVGAPQLTATGSTPGESLGFGSWVALLGAAGAILLLLGRRRPLRGHTALARADGRADLR